MNQLSIFDTAPHARNSDTSKAAALAIEPLLSALESKVLAVIAARPQTCDEIEVIANMAHQTVSARLRGLAMKGRIVDSGERRATRSGRMAVVWRMA